MNYIKELNAFKDWLLVNELPAGAIVLWYTLMSVNNSVGWKERFNAPNAVVGQLTGLSKQGILDARKRLVEEGLITCENGKKGKAPVYELVSLLPNSVPSLDSSAYQSPGESLNIPKQKQTQERREEETRDEQIVAIYEANIGKLSPLAKQEFLQWCNKLGDDVMVEAIKLETKHNGRTSLFGENFTGVGWGRC